MIQMMKHLYDKPRAVCCKCGHTAILKYCEPVKTGPKGSRMYRCAECARQRKDMLRKWRDEQWETDL